MSDCRWGVKPYRNKPDFREYDQSKPIRGVISWEDGTVSRITYARYVNGVERRVATIDMDGDRFERVRECVMTRTFRGYPCNDYTCSECGKTHCAERASEWCPRCGARRTKVVDEDGAEIPFDSAMNVEGVRYERDGN